MVEKLEGSASLSRSFQNSHVFLLNNPGTLLRPGGQQCIRVARRWPRDLTHWPLSGALGKLSPEGSAGHPCSPVGRVGTRVHGGQALRDFPCHNEGPELCP